jgi:hypothetical protein
MPGFDEASTRPVSGRVNEGFELPFGPFGLTEFKIKVAFKLHVQIRIETSVSRMDVSSATMIEKFALTLSPLSGGWIHAELSAIRAKTLPLMSIVLTRS